MKRQSQGDARAPGASYIVLSLVVLLASLCLSLSEGELKISLLDMPRILREGGTLEHSVLTQIRIPRTLLALAVGCSLSLCGVILQGVYRNPLVEPYTLGISGGASLGVTLAIVAGWSALGAWVLPAFGFVGALMTILLVYALSMLRRAPSISRMLLCGVMVSFISSSLVLFLMSVTSVENLPGIVYWTMGSLSRSSDAVLYLLPVVSLLVLGCAMLFALPLNALRMGEPLARHLGVETHGMIRILFVLTSLLTGCCIAVSGVIGFVGLIIPHVTRYFVGQDHRILLPASYINGGIFLVLSDILARTVIYPNELPIGVITGIVGGISFLIIIGTRRRSREIW